MRGHNTWPCFTLFQTLWGKRRHLCRPNAEWQIWSTQTGAAPCIAIAIFRLTMIPSTYYCVVRSCDFHIVLRGSVLALAMPVRCCHSAYSIVCAANARIGEERGHVTTRRFVYLPYSADGVWWYNPVCLVLMGTGRVNPRPEGRRSLSEGASKRDKEHRGAGNEFSLPQTITDWSCHPTRAPLLRLPTCCHAHTYCSHTHSPLRWSPSLCNTFNLSFNNISIVDAIIQRSLRLIHGNEYWDFVLVK